MLPISTVPHISYLHMLNFTELQIMRNLYIPVLLKWFRLFNALTAHRQIFFINLNFSNQLKKGLDDTANNLAPVTTTTAMCCLRRWTPYRRCPWYTGDCEISPRIFGKMLNGPSGILRDLGETDSRKNFTSKISCQTPFKEYFTVDGNKWKGSSGIKKTGGPSLERWQAAVAVIHGRVVPSPPGHQVKIMPF